jgi:hypothetical protein
LPVSRRLTLTSDMDDSEIANRIRYAVDELLPKDGVKMADLEDVVHEYVDGPRHHTSRYKRFGDLWRLVPGVPIEFSLLLINKLPCQLNDITQALLDGFNDD